MLLQDADPGTAIRGWAALVISIVALVQLWTIAAWKRFVRRGKLRAHETGNIEVGFSTFGPTIALLGTLRALNQEVFVEAMTVRVIRVRDRAQRLLRWRAFRSSAVNVSGAAPEIDLARSFLVQPTAPYNYNIVFSDQEFEAEFRARLNEVGDRWRTYAATAASQASPPADLEKVLQDGAASQPFFSHFFSEAFTKELYAAVEERFFWHAGDYEVHLEVDVSRPAVELTTAWRFHVSDKDSRSLRTNAVGIFRDLSGYRAFYQFAYPQYISLDDSDRAKLPNAAAP